jgi:hypothetical protein
VVRNDGYFIRGQGAGAARKRETSVHAAQLLLLGGILGTPRSDLTPQTD